MHCKVRFLLKQIQANSSEDFQIFLPGLQKNLKRFGGNQIKDGKMEAEKLFKGRFTWKNMGDVREFEWSLLATSKVFQLNFLWEWNATRACVVSDITQQYNLSYPAGPLSSNLL